MNPGKELGRSRGPAREKAGIFKNLSPAKRISENNEMTEVILEQRQNVTVSIENVPILPGDGKENILQFPVSFVLKLLPRRLLNE